MSENLIDQYINQQPPEVVKRLQAIRRIIHETVPETQESIRYKIPAFSIGTEHIYFAAYRSHIGMYPIYHSLGIDKVVANYRSPKAKDAVHFRHDQPLPIDVIRQIVVRFATKV
jgi:uncharacterized protein YdhG (YjbR/CyaY superfamily)